MDPTTPQKGQPPENPTPPVMDIVAPPSPEAPKEPEKDEATEVHHDSKKAVVNKPPKRSGNGVGLAIFATIVIVLGLAALMVYAYLKTKNVSAY